MKMADVRKMLNDDDTGCVWLSLFKVDPVFDQLRVEERVTMSYSAAFYMNNSNVYQIGFKSPLCTSSVGTRQVRFYINMSSEYAFRIDCIDDDTGLHLGTLKGLAIKDY